MQTATAPKPSVRDADPDHAFRAAMQSLDDQQLDAVLTTEGPVLVLAGAGSGKTRVLTTRVAHILRSGRCPPDRIMAVTFTNKAAREMTSRIEALLGRPADGLWVGTYYRLSLRIIRSDPAAVGLDPNFSIVDRDDQVRLIKSLTRDLRLDAREHKPQEMLARISAWKDRGLLPADLHGDEPCMRLYAAYQERLARSRATDFDDLILSVVRAFRNRPDWAAAWARHFRYILADEYQDTSHLQESWLGTLASGHRNLCCVADEDQTVFEWRGADVANVLRFAERRPRARVLRLENNYRSQGHIVASAGGLVAHNRNRLGRAFRTANGPGRPVAVCLCHDADDEAAWIAAEALRLRAHRPDMSIAVLVRTARMVPTLEKGLGIAGVPYRLLARTGFFDRAEVRDALAYLRLVANPRDDLAFARIINVPRRGIGKAQLESIRAASERLGCGLAEAAKAAARAGALSRKAVEGLRALFSLLAGLRRQSPSPGPGEGLDAVLTRTGYRESLASDPDSTARMANLDQLIQEAARHTTLTGFLEHAALFTETDKEGNAPAVAVMTMHAAKGLEFDAVFLPGWEEGTFPHARVLENGEKGIEEERRLGYVAITRGRTRVFIGSAAKRYGEACELSRFVFELPAGSTEFVRPCRGTTHRIA